MKELEKEMEKNNISLRSRFQNHIPMFNRRQSITEDMESFQKFKEQRTGISEELEQKTRNCFIKLYKTLTHKNLTLYKIFLTYDADRSGMLTIDEFGKILRRLDSTISEEETNSVFNFIDTDQSKTIEFDELNNYYCKVNGIPVSMDLPQEYQNKKIQEKTPYYQQMKQGNALNEIQPN